MFWRKREDKAPALDSDSNSPPLRAKAVEGAPMSEVEASMPESSIGDSASPAVPEDSEEILAPVSNDFGAAQLEGRVIEAISTVFDPEIPVNIYELGLIYDIQIDGMSDVKINMTLTSPACPVAGSLPGDVQRVVENVEGVRGVDVELVWEPPWTPDRMSEAARLELGFM